MLKGAMPVGTGRACLFLSSACAVAAKKILPNSFMQLVHLLSQAVLDDNEEHEL